MSVRIYTAEIIRDGKPDVLWPAERPIEWLMKVKSRMPRAMYNAQYNNDPSGLRGVKYDTAWLQFYLPSELPPLNELIGIQGGDPATSEKKTADYFGHCTAGRHKDTGVVYILDLQYAQISAPKHLAFLEAQFTAWKIRKLAVNTVRIESIGPQQGTTQNLIAQTRQSSRILMPIEEFHPKGSKEDRFNSMIPFLSNGTVLFPGELLTDGNKTMVDRPGFNEFVKEFAQFPRGGRDDILDAVFIALDGIITTTPSAEISEEDIQEMLGKGNSKLDSEYNEGQLIARLIEIEQELNSVPENQYEDNDYRSRVLGRKSLVY